MRVCDCGSEEYGEAQYDGRGIYLCKTCPACHDQKMSRYNPVILGYYTQADIDESIEPEDY
jgi:cbb3-type cytochrome oxidase cytochrome c subunit